MPARDEAATVADNVVAARGCRYVREVIVVDDGSDDDTAERAVSAPAPRSSAGTRRTGSKAHAMARASRRRMPPAILFVDADCTGLTAAHLDAICGPFVEGRAAMSIGTFDYGPFWNPLVLRFPPFSGERCVPRWVFEAIPPDKLDGYTIEMRINEVIAEGRLPTVGPHDGRRVPTAPSATSSAGSRACRHTWRHVRRAGRRLLPGASAGAPTGSTCAASRSSAPTPPARHIAALWRPLARPSQVRRLCREH